MWTRAGSESAFIFRMTWPRWAFTVISLMPSSPPTCLFKRPEATRHHDLAFARGQRRVILPKHLGLRGVLQCAATALDGVANRAQQLVVSERLGKELDGSGLHRLDARVDIAVLGDEDDRQLPPFDSDALLKIQPVDVRQGDVEDETAWHRCSGACEKLPRRCERLALPARYSSKQFQRFTHRDVVSDNEHHGRCMR